MKGKGLGTGIGVFVGIVIEAIRFQIPDGTELIQQIPTTAGIQSLVEFLIVVLLMAGIGCAIGHFFDKVAEH